MSYKRQTRPPRYKITTKHHKDSYNGNWSTNDDITTYVKLQEAEQGFITRVIKHMSPHIDQKHQYEVQMACSNKESYELNMPNNHIHITATKMQTIHGSVTALKFENHYTIDEKRHEVEIYLRPLNEILLNA